MEEKENKLKMVEIPELMYKLLMKQAACSCKMHWMNQKLGESVADGSFKTPFSQQEFFETCDEHEKLITRVSDIMRDVINHYEKEHGEIKTEDAMEELKRNAAHWN